MSEVVPNFPVSPDDPQDGMDGRRKMERGRQVAFGRHTWDRRIQMKRSCACWASSATSVANGERRKQSPRTPLLVNIERLRLEIELPESSWSFIHRKSNAGPSFSLVCLPAPVEPVLLLPLHNKEAKVSENSVSLLK